MICLVDGREVSRILVDTHDRSRRIQLIRILYLSLGEVWRAALRRIAFSQVERERELADIAADMRAFVRDSPVSRRVHVDEVARKRKKKRDRVFLARGISDLEQRPKTPTLIFLSNLYFRFFNYFTMRASIRRQHMYVTQHILISEINRKWKMAIRRTRDTRN